MKLTIRYGLVGFGLAAAVTAIILINTNAAVEYPMHVWRMDLDDALVGVGTLLLGAAAIWTVWLKAREADMKAEALERKLNGGLSSLASQIMMDELKQSGVDTSLAKRVASVETELLVVKDERDDCREQVAAQNALIESIHRRLDESGIGRNEDRGTG